MKKYLIIGLLVFAPFLVKAETTYFFLNGSGYNVNGNLTHYRFMDGKCYDVNGTYTPECSVSISTSTITSLDLPVVTPTQSVPTISNQPTTSTTTSNQSNTLVGGNSSSMLPPLTDSEIQDLLYKVSYNHNMMWPITFNVSGYPISCYRPTGGNLSLFTSGQQAILNNLNVQLDGQTIDCSAKYYPDTLPLGTPHTFQIIYHEEGREDSVVYSKEFTTITQ